MCTWEPERTSAASVKAANSGSRRSPPPPRCPAQPCTRRRSRPTFCVTQRLSLLRFRPEARPNPGLSASCLTSIWQSVRHVRQGQYHGRSLFAAGFDLTWLTSLTLRGTSLPVSARHFAKSIRNQVQITRAMRLLNAGVDTSVIALWMGHENVATTQVYIHADLALKERAIARTAPQDTPPGRYQPPDAVLAFLDGL